MSAQRAHRVLAAVISLWPARPILGVAAYLTIYLTTHAGLGSLASALIAIAATTLLAMLFGLALRASGLGFLMITLALGQILWGIAYRWGEPRRRRQWSSGGPVRPRAVRGGVGDLMNPTAFFYFTLIFLVLSGVG